MNWKEFMSKVKSNELKSVYLFCGKEVYLIDYTVKFVKEHLIQPSLESLNYVILEGEEIELDNIIDACETLPFMSEKKLVVIKDLPQLVEGGNKSAGLKEGDIKFLSQYITELDSYVCLIFTVKGGEAVKTNSLYKAIKKAGDIVEFNKLRGSDLNSWVEQKFNSYNKRISKANVNYFIQQSYYFDSNMNKTLYDLENEINKICNYRTGNKEIIKEDIDNILSKSLEMNIFNLLASVSSKNGEEALRKFNEIYLSNQPVLFVLHMIIRQLRNMLNYKILKEKGYSSNDINKKMSMSQYEFQKISIQSKNFTVAQLEKAMFYCLDTDNRLKTSSIDERLAMEMLITNLCYKI